MSGRDPFEPIIREASHEHPHLIQGFLLPWSTANEPPEALGYEILQRLAAIEAQIGKDPPLWPLVLGFLLSLAAGVCIGYAIWA